MKNNSKSKQVEYIYIYILIISNSKNNNYNSNNNLLKCGQNHRLGKKQTLIWIRNWLGLLRILRIQALHDKQLKKMGYITPVMGYYPRNR